MAVPSRITPRTETDVAVLQVQVQNIEDRVDEIKIGMRDINESVKENHKSMIDCLKEIQSAAEDAHRDLNKKISALEKWRWMIMGAGVVFGSLGLETVSKLLK